jgi:DsbC/DsbD-like thiol-disulfide interchange protein
LRFRQIVPTIARAMRTLLSSLLLPLVLMGCASRVHDPVAPDRGPSASERLAAEVPEPDGRRRVEAGAALDPHTWRAGEMGDAVVLVRIAPGWHIYPLNSATGPFTPTTLTGDAPAGAAWAGPWRAQDDAGRDVYEDSVTFVRPLRLAGDMAPGPITVSIELTYGACDAFSCLPPKVVTLTAAGEVVTRSPAKKEKR